MSAQFHSYLFTIFLKFVEKPEFSSPFLSRTNYKPFSAEMCHTAQPYCYVGSNDCCS